MKRLPIILILISLLAGCATKSSVCVSAISGYPYAKNRTYRIVKRWESRYNYDVAKLISSEMSQKGYVKDNDDPDFMLSLDIKNFKIRKVVPAPAYAYDPMGGSGTQEYYGATTVIEYVWRISASFIDPKTKKAFLRSSSEIKTMKEDMGKHLQQMVDSLMRDIPDAGQVPKNTASYLSCS